MSDDSRNGAPRACSGGGFHRKSKPKISPPTCSPSPPEVGLGHTFIYVSYFAWVLDFGAVGTMLLMTLSRVRESVV